MVEIKCKVCGGTFTSNERFYRHAGSFSKDRCDKCGHIGTIEEIRKHMEVTHPGASVFDYSTLYYCEHCKQELPREGFKDFDEALAQHMFTHVETIKRTGTELETVTSPTPPSFPTVPSSLAPAREPPSSPERRPPDQLKQLEELSKQVSDLFDLLSTHAADLQDLGLSELYNAGLNDIAGAEDALKIRYYERAIKLYQAAIDNFRKCVEGLQTRAGREEIRLGETVSGPAEPVSTGLGTRIGHAVGRIPGAGKVGKAAGSAAGAIRGGCAAKGIHSPPDYKPEDLKELTPGSGILLCPGHYEQLRPTYENAIRAGKNHQEALNEILPGIGVGGLARARVLGRATGFFRTSGFLGFFFFEWVVLAAVLWIGPYILSILLGPVALAYPNIIISWLGGYENVFVYLLWLTFGFAMFNSPSPSAKVIAALVLLAFVPYYLGTFQGGYYGQMINRNMLMTWSQTQCYLLAADPKALSSGVDVVSLCLEKLQTAGREATSCIDCLQVSPLVKSDGKSVRASKNTPFNLPVEFRNLDKEDLRDIYITLYDKDNNPIQGLSTLTPVNRGSKCDGVKGVQEGKAICIGTLKPNEVYRATFTFPKESLAKCDTVGEGGAGTYTFKHIYGYRISTEGSKTFAIFKSFDDFQSLGIPSDVGVKPRTTSGPAAVTIQAGDYYTEPYGQISMLAGVGADKGIIEMEKLELKYFGQPHGKIKCAEEKPIKPGESISFSGFKNPVVKQGNLFSEVSCTLSFDPITGSRALITLEGKADYVFKSVEKADQFTDSASFIISDCGAKETAGIEIGEITGSQSSTLEEILAGN